jgi:predicted transcriptional regulator
MSVRLTQDTRDRLRAVAAWQKRTAHALAAEAIQNLIEQKEREHAWNQGCVDALNHCDETGLHVTHDEVMTWLDSIVDGNELPPPVCHV